MCLCALACTDLFTLKQVSQGSGPPIFSSFTQIFTVMDTFSCVGGNTVLYFVLLLDRNISESTQRFQWVIPEDSVTFQQAERAPGLRPGRGQGNTGRQRSGAKHKKPEEEGDSFWSSLEKKEETGQECHSEELKRERIRMWQGERRDLEREWGCESTQTQWKSLSSYSVPIKVHWPGRACDKLSQRLYIWLNQHGG